MPHLTLEGDAKDAQRELELEAAALKEFLALLDSEQQALKEYRIDNLSELTEEKGRCMAVLVRHSDQRAKRLKAEGCRTDEEGMRAWLTQRSAYPAVAAAWARVTELAAKARDQNEVNGWVVSLQMQRTGRQLALLNRMANNDPTYSSRGVEHSLIRQRSLGEA